MRKVNKEKERGVDTYVHGSIYNCKKKKQITRVVLEIKAQWEIFWGC